MKLILFQICCYGYFLGCLGINTYDLEDYCKEEGHYDLSMIGEDIYAGQLNFTFKSSIPDDFVCTVIIGSNGFDRDRLAFYFTHFDLGDNCGAGETWLKVVEGDLTTEPDPIPGLPTRLCGRTFDYTSREFTTSWRHLQVEYHANKPELGSGFSIVFKHFSDPPCANYQYSCDNGRCIYKSLKCNGNNPCGDNSDCKQGLTVGAVIGIVIGCAVALGLCVFLYRYLPSCIKDSNTGTESQTAEQDRFSRVPYSASPSNNRDIFNPTAAEPPSYGHLKHRSRDSDEFRSDESYMPDRVHMPPNSNQQLPFQPTAAPMADNNDVNEEYRPPPPSYDMAITYRDVYKVSESEPNRV